MSTSKAAESKKVIVVGAGVCGLTAAYRLRQHGFDPVVLDGNDYVGGRTRTHEAGGFLMDEGAALFPSSYNETYQLAVELGLQSELQKVAAKTVLYLDGRYEPFDLDHPIASFLGAHYLSKRDKLSLLRLAPIIVKYWSKLGFSDLSTAAQSDQGTAEELCRNCGVSDAAYQLLINPLIRAMSTTGGNQVSATALLWYLKNFSNRKLYAFRGGMQTLALRLSHEVTVLKGHCVERVDSVPQGVEVVVRVANETKTLNAAFCIVTTDGKDLGEIYGHGLTSRQNAFLEQLRYVPLKVVNFIIASRPALDAFAVQVPEVVDTEAAIFVLGHNLSEARAPVNQGVITFCGTADWQMRMQNQSEAACIADVRTRAIRILPFLADCEQSAHMTSWKRGTAVAYPGLFRNLQQFVADIDLSSRVLYAGDYLSIPTVNTAVSTANVVAARLSTRDCH